MTKIIRDLSLYKPLDLHTLSLLKPGDSLVCIKNFNYTSEQGRVYEIKSIKDPDGNGRRTTRFHDSDLVLHSSYRNMALYEQLLSDDEDFLLGLID